MRTQNILKTIFNGIVWAFAFLRRLGWFYLLSFMVAVVALVAFAEITDEVYESGDLQTINRVVLHLLHYFSMPTLDQLALIFSTLGAAGISTIIACAILAILLIRRGYPDFVSFLLLVTGAALLTFLLKNIFALPRPDLYESLAPETSFSYPSGHALVSVCLYGYWAVTLVLQKPGSLFRWGLALLLSIFPLGIIWSRLYLGVHWVSDVTAGVFVAIFWLAICLMLRHWKATRIQIRLD